MYKGCRYFLVLAALIVGLGVLGGANEVEAQRVTAVSIVTPDSGVVRGIDSLIVAKATVFDVPTNKNLTVVMYLVTDNKDTVLTEATSAYTDFSGDKPVYRRVGELYDATPDVPDDALQPRSEPTEVGELYDAIFEAIDGALIDASRANDADPPVRDSYSTNGVLGNLGLIAVQKQKNVDEDGRD